MLMLPELIVIATAFLVLLVDLFVTNGGRKVLGPLALAGLAVAASALIGCVPQTGELFGGRFGMDAVSWWFKLLFIIAAFITIALSIDMMDGRALRPAKDTCPRGEYYTILLFTVSGMMYLISARDLVMLYVSLELATVPLFALSAWQRNVKAGEAGIKYLVVGALASALLLYGFSILYGMTGDTSLTVISKALKFTPAFFLAAAMITAGVGFKMTIVPFHMWAAEVYQGAPTPVTAYLSVASKGAGLALMFQLFFRLFGPFLAGWQLPIAIMAAITMTVGNTAAIVQHNVKRFMAFSAISQAGYIIMGFLGPVAESAPSMIFYMLVYIVTNLSAFAVIIFVENQAGHQEVEDYRGLARTNPVMALALMIALFGLAGIPPLSGFVGKFFLFSIASKAGYHWLVALAAVNSTISLYYYLRIVRQMYIEKPEASAQPLPVTPVLGGTVLATAVASMALGVVPLFYQLIHANTMGWMELLVTR